MAFLFGVTTWTPWASHSPYLSATASEEVLSTITAAPSGVARSVRDNFRDERVQIRGDGRLRGERPGVPFRDRAIADGGVHRVRVHTVRAGREDHVLGVRARRDAEVESAGGEQRRGVRANLLERRLADEAGADETDVEGYLRRREEAV